MGDLIWSFSPWLLFLLATRFTSLSGAIALGLVAALVVAARAIGHHHLHLLDPATSCISRGSAWQPYARESTPKELWRGRTRTHSG